MIYLLDTDCFIKASRYTYPFDIAESFWRKLAEEAGAHKFYSIDKVYDEIKIHNDELSKWCGDSLPDDFFISTETEDVYKKYAELVRWAQSKDIKQRGIDKFINGDKADIYFVALASLEVGKYTVVTNEVSAKESKKDIKLPDVCEEFRIRTINFIQMLRELKIKF